MLVRILAPALVLAAVAGYLASTLLLAWWSEYALPFALLGAVGLALALGDLARRPTVAGALSLVLCGVIAAGAGKWIYVDSVYEAREERLAVGEVMPAFRLPDQDGRPFTFRAPRDNPALLLFYRGHW